MTTNAKIKSDIQTLDIDSDLVELYSLDVSSLGGSVYYFTPGTLSGTSVYFNGVEYTPLPVKLTGLEHTGDGRLPRPKLAVSNINLTFSSLVNTYNDLVGSKFTRIRTFKKYLDGQSEADPNAQFPGDIFYIEQKIRQSKYQIEWELVSAIDIEGVYLPKNQVTAYCAHRYREFKDGSFDYNAPVSCPYTGTNYFDEYGNTTTSGSDKCGKTLYDCKLRYPNDSDQLPFKGFPVVGRFGYPYR